MTSMVVEEDPFPFCAMASNSWPKTTSAAIPVVFVRVSVALTAPVLGSAHVKCPIRVIQRTPPSIVAQEPIIPPYKLLSESREPAPDGTGPSARVPASSRNVEPIIPPRYETQTPVLEPTTCAPAMADGRSRRA